MTRAWADRSGLSRWLPVVGGLTLMALGIAAGAAVADGLAAAAILPLAGALLLIPAAGSRRLPLLCAMAFAASMAGEIAAYTVGGMTNVPGLISPALSLTESAAMLVFAYGLIWWMSNQLVIANATSERAAAAERRALVLNERLLETLDPQQVLSVIADSLKPVVAYDNLTIYRVDREAGLLRPVLARDRFAALILENSFPMEQGLTGWAVTHGEPVCANDSNHDPRARQIPGTPAEDESLIVVPLIINGRVGGTLNVGRMGGKEAHFSENEFAVARLFARQASIAMQNAEAHFALWTRAETDALTGLRNRGAFEQDIKAVLSDKSHQPVTLLMLDLDDFKSFNDEHGHRVGDSLLASIANSIEAGVRVGDKAYRYGGDEFAVLLPGASGRVGAEVAERIGGTIRSAMAVASIPVTASIGAACTKAGVVTPENLIESADAALYQAKAVGGNTVVLAGQVRHQAPSRHHETGAPRF